jgi:hypothetical protein
MPGQDASYDGDRSAALANPEDVEEKSRAAAPRRTAAAFPRASIAGLNTNLDPKTANTHSIQRLRR